MRLIISYNTKDEGAVRPVVDWLETLRPELFPVAGYSFRPDPAYEPERPEGSAPDIPLPDPEKTAVFALLQKLNRLNLLVPEDAPHMWHAAIQSKSCRLTPLGEHYWRVVVDDRICPWTTSWTPTPSKN